MKYREEIGNLRFVKSESRGLKRSDHRNNYQNADLVLFYESGE